MIKAAYVGRSWGVASLVLSIFLSQAFGDQPGLIRETPLEFFGSADFNKDGRKDIVIVDKASGKFRVGYLGVNGLYDWVDCRNGNIKSVSGFSIGNLLNTDVPALVFTSPDANGFSIVEASSPAAPQKPVSVPFADALGPNNVVALDIGGEGNTPVADLVVGSIYNSPDENLATLHRNDAAGFPKVGEATLKGPLLRGSRLVLRAGGPDYLCGIIREEQSSKFVIEDLTTGKAVRVIEAAGLPADAEYAVGSLVKESVDFVFYQPGQSKVTLRTIGRTGDKLQLGKETMLDLVEPVKEVLVLEGHILAVNAKGEKAALFRCAGNAVQPSSTLVSTNNVITGVMDTPAGLALFASSPNGRFSTRYNLYTLDASGAKAGPYGGLSSLSDNDNVTIPDIHSRIVKKTTVKDEGGMQFYTNTIPGTRVTYVMVPIKGGEFTMGSPESEAKRKPDEGPQHKVKISPFWMGQCEVTWNEYELFMYPDEEKRSRTTVATDPDGDKLADAVTHPSRPYVEMSFGMGKEGFPAISMTQHAANKYCQWLSAKTGEFYRLPTEAEWEYACRAGTTTAYFFGEDSSKLAEYGWFEMNSDFKYQKVGKKKPNPWGLHDMCGNVVEWVLDQYDPDFYKTSATAVVIDPWNKATRPYPHAVRGGSWDDPEASCRSAARRGSDRSWKMQDPQLPKSIWYFSDAQFVGFRVVRPLKVPPPEEMQKFWTSGVERD